MQNEELCCASVKARLFDLATDLLDDEERSALMLHIESCPECAREYAGIQAILSAAADVEEVEPPEGLKTAVFERVKAESAKRPTKLRRYIGRAAGILIPIAACTALAVGTYQSGLYDSLISSDDAVTSGITDITENTSQKEDEKAKAEDEKAKAAENNIKDDNSPISDNSAEPSVPIKSTEPQTPPASENGSSVTPDNTVQRDTEIPKSTSKDSSPEEAVNTADSHTDKAVVQEESADTSAADTSAADTSAADTSNEVSEPTGTEENPTDDTAPAVMFSMKRMIISDYSESGELEAEANGKSSDSGAEADAIAGGGVSYPDDIIPAGCTIVSDNPSELAAVFVNIADTDADTVTFIIESTEYEMLKSSAAELGAVITDEQGESDGEITVTVIKK